MPISTTLAFVDPFLGALYFAARLVLWPLLAMMLAMFVPDPLKRTSQAVLNEPLIAGGLGLLTIVVAPLVLAAIGLTILLLPVTFTGILLLALAWAFGLISLGTELGKRFIAIFNREAHPALAAGIGTFLLVLTLNGMELALQFLCVGWLPKVLVGLLGLGGVLLTRFGAVDYAPRAGLRAYAVTPAAPVTPAEPPAAE